MKAYLCKFKPLQTSFLLERGGGCIKVLQIGSCLFLVRVQHTLKFEFQILNPYSSSIHIQRRRSIELSSCDINATMVIYSNGFVFYTSLLHYGTMDFFPIKKPK